MGLPQQPSTPGATMESHGSERRRHPRHQLHAYVEMRGGGEVAVLPVANISAGGAFLRMAPEDLPEIALGEQVAVFLDASGDGDPLYITLEATVVRIERAANNDRTGLALRWIEHSPEVAGRLARALQHLSKR